jgi:hypothetical protein
MRIFAGVHKDYRGVQLTPAGGLSGRRGERRRARDAAPGRWRFGGGEVYGIVFNLETRVYSRPVDQGIIYHVSRPNSL